ncbi:hypothetical protein [Ferruginibacter albus]|uniref:hypothetical protein n=1 Tax=Ferruginibacter albus TaxID=2875540 RepID=UPI001CC3C7C9|nr:hypothetical protein [Ferruginibacter albus]UAY53140.1 hypothetical protein K9M53_05555 [Ferruginibacter albus]
MTLRNSFYILLVSILFTACFNSTQKKKYAVTTYFTSFDSAHVSLKNLHTKFKYSYEAFNADSNLIYKEQFTTPFDNDTNWGMLSEKEKYFYDNKEKTKGEKEFGLYLPHSQVGSAKDKDTYTYEYTNGELTKWLVNQKPYETYKYNDQKKLIELHRHFGSNLFTALNTYSNGLKIKSEYFPFDSINTSMDTFIYKNTKLVEKNSFNKKGEMTTHRIFIRDEKGKLKEEKWKEPYLDWRQREDGQWINAEFNQGNRYFYDSRDRPIKTEYYQLDEHYRSEKLIIVYDFQYD